MTIEEEVMQLSALYPMGLLGADGPITSQLEAQVGQGIGYRPSSRIYPRRSGSRRPGTLEPCRAFLSLARVGVSSES